MKKDISKSLRLPSLLVLGSTVCVMAIGLLGKWEYVTELSGLLSLLPLALFLLPVERDGKDIVAMLTKPAPAVCLFFVMLLSSASDPDICDAGTCLQLFALGFSCLVFNGRKKGLAHLLVCEMYVVLTSFILSAHYRSDYLSFCISSAACIILVVASISGWYGKEWKWLYTVTSLVGLWWNAYDVGGWNYEYLIDLFFSPYHSSYDSAVFQEQLSNMHFIGRTSSPSIANVLYNAPVYDRLLFVTSAEYGWFVYVLTGLSLAGLVIGLILLAKRRKGLGRLFPLAALGVVSVPLTLYYLDNLGVICAEIIRVPLLSGGLATNLLAILLLRLSITSTADRKPYSLPSQAQTVSEWLEIDYLVNLVDSASDGKDELPDDYGQICAFAIPADQCRDEICASFEDGAAAIPFKGEVGKSIAGRDLLMSRYYGGLADILGIFSQLKIEKSEKHFVKVSVSEDSNISRLLFGVERVTNAMANQANVDYCVCIDSDLSSDHYRIQTISVKEPN